MSGARAPTLRFPGFVGEWERTTVGEIGPVSMCKRVMKDQTSLKGDVPFFKIGTFGKDADAFIEQDLFDDFRVKYSYPNPGDILISAAGTIGRLVVFDGKPAYFQDSNIVWVANDETRTLNPFLYYCYQNTRWTTEDTTIARLYNENLRGIELVQPNLTEQQKVADFLGTVDAKLDALRRKKSGLEAFKSGLMQRLFSQELRFTRDDGTEFPEWDQASFGEIAERSSDKFDPRDVHEGMPVIDLENIESGTGRIINAGQSDESGSLKSLFRPGEVLFGKLRPYLRKYAQPDFDGCCSSEIWVLRGKRVSNDFLFYLIQSGRFMELATISSGSKMPRADWSIMSSAEFEIPHPDEQRKIAAALSAMDAKIAVVANQITHMETFKKGLLQQMFV